MTVTRPASAHARQSGSGRHLGASLVPVETARRLARELPDARLQLVEGAGHHLPRRAPGYVVADVIVAFVAAAEAVGSPG